jgi:hypothetical protein
MIAPQTQTLSPLSRFPRQVILTIALLLAVVIALFTSPGSDAQDQEPQVNSNVGIVTNSNGETTTTQEPPARSTVRGRVIYDDTEQPVRRARLMLVPATTTGREGGESNAVSNLRGEFRFRNVAPGRYFVIVDAPGILTPVAFVDFTRVRRNGGREGNDLSEAEKVFDAIIVDGVRDVSSDVRAVRGGIITGAVAYADGAPAVNINVQIMRRKNGKLVPIIPNINTYFASMRTDDRGMYRVSGLPAGEYFVRVAELNTSEKGERQYGPMGGMGAGDALAATYYPAATEARDASPIEVTLGVEKANVDITLPDRRANIVEGVIVRKAGGVPIENATVRISRAGDEVNPFTEGENGQSVKSNEQGRWSFPEVPAGAYTLAIEPPNSYETSGGNMNMSNMNGSMGGNMNGGNMNANLSIGAAAPARPRTPKLSAKQQELKVADADISLQIELSEGGRVSGKTIVEGKKPADEDGSVAVVLRNADGSEAQTDYGEMNNTFEFDGVAAGEYFIDARGYEVGSSDPDFYVKSVSANNVDALREPVRVAEGKELRDVRVVLATDVARLAGRVRSSADDKPLAGRAILILPADAKLRRNRSFHGFAQTDMDGRFTFDGAPGEYLVVVTKDAGDEPALTDAAIAAANPTRVSLRANERREIDFAHAP